MKHRWRFVAALAVVVGVLGRSSASWAVVAVPEAPTVDPGLGSTWCIDYAVYCGSTGQALADTASVAAEEGLPSLTAAAYTGLGGVFAALWPVAATLFLSGDSASEETVMQTCVDAIERNGGYPQFSYGGVPGAQNGCPAVNLLQYGVYQAAAVAAEPWQRAFCSSVWYDGTYFNSGNGWTWSTSDGYPSGLQAAVDTACPSAWRPFFLDQGPAPTTTPSGIAPMPTDSAGNVAYCNVNFGGSIQLSSTTYGGPYWFVPYAMSCNLSAGYEPLVGANWGGPGGSGAGTLPLGESYAGLAANDGNWFAGNVSGLTSTSNAGNWTIGDAAGNVIRPSALVGVDRPDPAGSNQWLVDGYVDIVTSAGGHPQPTSFPSTGWGLKVEDPGTLTFRPGAIVNVGQQPGAIVSFPSYPSQSFSGATPAGAPGVVISPSLPGPVANPSPGSTPTIPGVNPQTPPVTGAPPATVPGLGNTSPDGNTGTSWLGQTFNNAINWLGGVFGSWLALVVQTLQWLGGLVTHLEIAVTNALNAGFGALEAVEASGLGAVTAAVEAVMAAVQIGTGVAVAGTQSMVAGLASLSADVVALPASIASAVGTQLQMVFIPTGTDIETQVTALQTSVNATAPGSMVASATGLVNGVISGATGGLANGGCGPTIGFDGFTVGGQTMPGFTVHLPSGPGCPGNAVDGTRTAQDQNAWSLDGYVSLVRGLIAFGFCFGFFWSLARSAPWVGNSERLGATLGEGGGSRIPLGFEGTTRQYTDGGIAEARAYLRGR